VPPIKVVVVAQDLRRSLMTRYELIAPTVHSHSQRGKLRVFAALRAAGSRSLSSVTVDARTAITKDVPRPRRE
jgi:hypothetical protein